MVFWLSFYFKNFSQVFYHPRFGLAINNGFTEVQPGGDASSASGLLRAFSVYLSAGYEIKTDSFFVFDIDLRMGPERSRIEIESAPDVYYYYHLRNNTLALCLSGGLPLSGKPGFSVD